jgi:hypothetical protein
VRYGVAPTPTGSSTHGFPSSAAAAVATSIASTHGGESVPMLTVSAPAMATKSRISSSACAMTGDAPMASSAFAATSIAT